MPLPSKKKFRKNRVKTMKKKIIKPPTNEKGVKYLIEPMSTVTNHASLKGDVIKKYVNGKLVDQIFVSDKKVKSIMKKISDKYKRYGGQPLDDKKKNPQENPQKVEVSDKTSFGHSLKTGFASGLGFAAAFEAIKWLFGSNKSSSDNDSAEVSDE